MKRRLILKATQPDVEDVVIPRIRRQAPQNRTQIANLYNLNNLLEKRVKHLLNEPLQQPLLKQRTKRFGMMPQTNPKLYLLRMGPRVLDLYRVSKDS
jgi:hypothetical protein